MKQGHGGGASNSSGCGCETSGGEKTRNPWQVAKSEWLAKPPLHEPGRQDRLTRIAEALE
jgi:hypothetical protein